MYPHNCIRPVDYHRGGVGGGRVRVREKGMCARSLHSLHLYVHVYALSVG